jgi:hypothetical protein
MQRANHAEDHNSGALHHRVHACALSSAKTGMNPESNVAARHKSGECLPADAEEFVQNKTRDAMARTAPTAILTCTRKRERNLMTFVTFRLGAERTLASNGEIISKERKASLSL